MIAIATPIKSVRDVSSAASPTGYETPLSKISTPRMYPHNDPEMSLPRRPGNAMLPPLSTRNVEGLNSGHTVHPVIDRLDNLSPPTPGHDDTPYIRFALEQITFDEEVVGPRRSSVLNDHFGSTRNLGADSSSNTISSPNGQPQPFRFPSSGYEKKSHSIKEQVLLPIDAPVGTQWKSLGYIPVPLRVSTLAALILLCLFMIAGILYSNIYTIRNSGLYDYDGNSTARYFLFQYLPQLLGIVILLWLFSVQSAMYRVLPYFSMSIEKEQNKLLQDTPIIPANFVLPDFTFFKCGEPVVGIVLLVFWLMNFTVPFLSCLYQTQFYAELESPRWRWSTFQDLGWVLVVWYLMLVAALLCCMIRFRRRNSALMWDPASIADVILLFQRSNILDDYARSEIEPDLADYVPPSYLRLGFWTPSGSHDIFHAIGEANKPLNRLSLMGELPKAAFVKEKFDSTDSFDIERYRYSNGSEFTRSIHSPFQRYRWCPWFLRDSCLLAWILAAVLLLIPFLVVSFVNQAVQNGFDPLLSSGTGSNGFSPSNFLYSFLPSLLATWLFLFWQPIDTFFKLVQPYANLASPYGTSAQRSLLQSYSAMPPIVVTFNALANRDFKLAYVTFVALASAAIPVLAGGIFTAQLFSAGDVRMVASMPGYLTMCVFVSIYALSFLVIWPTRKRYLPHAVNTIAGQLSFLYASPLLNDPAIRNVRSRADLITRLDGAGHMAASEIDEKGLTGEGRRKLRDCKNEHIDREPKFAFGIYLGRDSKEHLGIDRLLRSR
ncbi:hypothetical protein Dsin_032540 [Dipteronia sinensis]|uniref:Phosphoribosylaminoimidazole-succinocarboxamide synthase n=1 Tax=Dipteronia sinensis TaxID=43782 RepID=A0AAE0DP07_9ROSI|nr:hypothetical protein Dsin_032540 [Dipteronia sinensis]